MTIGAQLRRERVRAGLSQPRLADVLGATTSMVWKIENGQRNPSRTMIERWASATRAGVADLVIDGPALFDIEFSIEVRDPFVARRVFDLMTPDIRRLSAVWPGVGDNVLRLRARASALGSIVGLVGADVPEVGCLPAPSVQPVRGADDLLAWIRAGSQAEALAEVNRRMESAQVTGEVAVQQWGRVFVARVAGLAVDGSMRLQELVDGSPIGLFVPVSACLRPTM